MRMKWIRLGIVIFMLLKTVLTQQGYDYPKPETPFPSRDKPGTSSRFDGTQPSAPGYATGSSQSPGNYPSQPDRSGSSPNYATPQGLTENQSPSTGQRPVYPGQQISNNVPQNTGARQPSGGFPGPGIPSSGNQQGYNYPAPQKPFSPSAEGQQRAPGYTNNQKPSEGYPSSQQGLTGSQAQGQQGGYPGQQRPGGYPGAGQSASQFPSSGIQRPTSSDSLGNYPGVNKPSSQFPSGNAIGGNAPGQQGEYGAPRPFGTPSGVSYPGVTKPSSQFPSGNAIGGNAPGQQGEYGAAKPFGKPSGVSSPSGPSVYSQGKPQIPSGQQTNAFSRPREDFPNTETPSGQFPASGPGISAQGADGTRRPPFPPTGPDASRPSNGYTSNGASSDGPQGYPGAGTPARPQFPSGKPQNQDISGQQTPEGYTESGRRPAFGTTQTRPSTQGFSQRPSSDYLPPQQGFGKFPAPAKSGRPQFNTEGPRPNEENEKPAGPLRQPAFQSGNQYSTPENQAGDASFPSNGQNKPAGPFQRPGYPTSEQPGRYPSPSGGSSRPGQSSESDISKPRPGSGERPTNFPGSSGPQSGGFQNNAQGQQGDTNEASYEEGDYSAIPGEPDADYPVLSLVPDTSFRCEDQQFPGYYADVETRCQAFHVCANDKKYDFLCPNGTIFHQEYLVCVWWNQFDCSTAQSLYGINENIYDFSITGIQQTGGIPVPGSDFPSAQTPGGQTNQPQGPARPGAPGVPTSPGTYPKPSFPGQNSVDSAGPSTGFSSNTGGSRPSSSYPSGSAQTSEGYPNQRPQTEFGSYPTPGSQGSRFPPASPAPSGSAQVWPQESDRPQFGQPQSQKTNGYPSQGSQFPSSAGQTGTAQGSIAPERYPSGRPQGPGFSSGSATPQTPTLGTTQGPEGYSNGRPQGPSFPSGSRTPSFGQPQSQQPSGYPSSGAGSQGSQAPSFSGNQATAGPSQTPTTAEGYPSGRPTGPGKSQQPSYSQIGSQKPSEYPSNGAASQDSRFPSSPRRPGSQVPDTPDEYPNEKSQAPFDTQGVSDRPQSADGSLGYPSGRPQISGSSQEAGDRNQGGSRYPSGTTQPTEPGRQGAFPGQKPERYPTQGFGSSAGSQGSPSRPETPFPGSPKPHQPTREYLPPVSRK